MKKILEFIKLLYSTGLLYIFAGVGYGFYGFLYTLRLATSSMKNFLISFLVMVAVLAALLWIMLGGTPRSQTYDLEIRPHMSVRAVADSLMRHRIIRSPLVFRWYIKVRHTDRNMHAGMATFHEGEGIIAAARNAQLAHPIEEVITIPEGLTCEQSAGIISKVFTIDSSACVALCTDSAFTHACGIQARTCEGYLFPDTYRFPKNATARDVILKMTGRFITAWNAIAPSPEIQNRYSVAQIVTMASIVEKEAAVASERARIAAVFYNRLAAREPLGADPTVRYIYRKFSGPLYKSELNSESPYNTRKFRGLPPGPICSPGAASLAAASNPLSTRELFFVAKWDGSGEHDFSVTLAEHERKKLQIRAYNNRRIDSLKAAGAL